MRHMSGPKDFPLGRRQMLKDCERLLPYVLTAFISQDRQKVYPPILAGLPKGASIQQAAAAWSAWEKQELERAPLYWVSEPMRDLAVRAGASLPSFTYSALEIPPTARGLMFFEGAPILTYDEEVLPSHRVPGKPDVIPTNITAVAWRPVTRPGTDQLGTYFSVWSDGDAASALMDDRREPGLAEAYADWREREGSPLAYDNEFIVWDGMDTDELPALRGSDTTAQTMETVLAAWLLMQERFVGCAPVEYAPKQSKRLDRKGLTKQERAVTLVHIRRTEAVPTQRGGEAQERETAWLVSGHWRNQWYPSTQTHRPRWIAPYRKGNPAAPLEIRETVKVWDR